MTRRKFLPALTTRTQSIIWRVIAVSFVAGMALLCWHNIAQTLDSPILTHLAYGGSAKFERFSGGTAHVTRTGIDSIGIQLTHVSTQLQWLVALDIVNSTLIQTAVGLVFGVIWARTSAGHPFAPAVTRSLTALAIIVAVFGTFQEVLDSWVSLREAYEAVGNLPYGGAYYDQDGFHISGLAIIIAFGIGILASAFGIGARLTHDTEGLV